MTLLELIRQDLVQAMKAKDAATLSTLRLLSASLKNKAIEMKGELEDVDVLRVVRGDVKKLEDALNDFVGAAREDLAEKTRVEIAVLKKYLPAEMTAEALEEKVREILARVGIHDAGDMGKAMGAVMKELKDQVNGNRVREMVKKILR